MHSFSPADLLEAKAAAQSVLRQAKAAWRAQDAARLTDALHGCERLLQTLPPESLLADAPPPDPADPLARECALLWLWRGRILVSATEPEAVVQGLRSLDQAIARLQAAGAETRANTEASAGADAGGNEGEDGKEDGASPLSIAWMNRGGGLFRLGSREALAEAVRSYDQAIACMESLPDANPVSLGAAWMNRGAGLMHLDQPEETPDALASRLADAAASLEKAVALLEPVVAAHPAARRNLASSWANLGLLRSRRKDPAGALVAHRQAVELFRPLATTGRAAETFELAARLYNLGQAAGAAKDAELALAAGREALELATPLGRDDPQALELALRARHALCVVLGGALAPCPVPRPTPDQTARLQEARELVESGLAVLREVQARPPGAAAAGARLYEFGAWLHRIWQPGELGAFLLAHLGEDSVRAQIAAAAVRQTRQAVMQRGFTDTAHGGMEGMLDTLRSLGPVEERLKTFAEPTPPTV